MADAPKKQASPGFASLAKTYLMQKIGQAKGTELPAEYNDLRDSWVKTDAYMGKAVKLLRNYCRKAEKLSKMENEIGSYLVEAGLEDKHAQYSENLIKIGEAVKSLSMIHHAKNVNIVEKYVKPTMEFHDKMPLVDKVHKKLQSKVLAYDSQKSIVETNKDQNKQAQLQEELTQIEQAKDETYKEAETDSKKWYARRNTDHMMQIIELFLSFHYCHGEGYTMTSELTGPLEKIKEQCIAAKKSGGGDTKSSGGDKKPAAAENSRPAMTGMAKPASNVPVVTSNANSQDQDLLSKLKALAAEEKSKKGSTPAAAVTATKPTTTTTTTTSAPASNNKYMGQVVAAYEYDAQETTELSFKPGDVIKVTAQEDEWWTGELKGKTGQFPSNFVGELQPLGAKPPERKALLQTTALYDYDAAEQGEISLKANDKIKVYEKQDSWWVGEVVGTGKVGSFPANYTEAGQG